MKAKKSFGLAIMLMSITACTPVVYDATHRAPTGHVSVQTTYTQPSYRHSTTYQQIHPIEVTLYADNHYRGVYFQPVQLVIYNGQYVEIPVKNRRGRTDKIFAHYHNGDLHFDSDRNCRVIQGSTRYSYDKRWDKGYKYTKINAGKNYDLSGLHLQIRNVKSGKRQAKEVIPAKVWKKPVVVHANNGKKPLKQSAVKVLSRNNGKKVLVREQPHPVNSRAAKVSEYYTKNNQGRSTKVLIKKDKGPAINRVKTVKAANKPVIVEKINKHKQTTRIASMPHKASEKKADMARKVTQKQARPVVQIKKQAKPVVQTKKRAVEKVVGDSRSIKKSTRREISEQKKSVKVSQDRGTVKVDGIQAKFGKKSRTLKEGKSRKVNLVAKDGAKGNVSIYHGNSTKQEKVQE